MFTLVLLRSSIATLVAWSGGLLGALIGKTAGKHLTLLVNASLGALLAVTLFDILPDSLELVKLPVFAVSAGSGALIFWLIGKYVYPICPACSVPDASQMKSMEIARTATLLMITLGLHSFMDGAAVVVGDRIAHGVNIPVFIAVSLHKFPEGLALVLLLIGAGFRRRTALGWTIGIEAVTELGALSALLTVNRFSHEALGSLFANIGGGFLYLVVTAFISQLNDHNSHAAKTSRVRSFVTGGCGFAVAAATMAAAKAFVH